VLRYFIREAVSAYCSSTRTQKETICWWHDEQLHILANRGIAERMIVDKESVRTRLI